MNYSLQAVEYHKDSNVLTSVSVFLLAVLLHQSQVIFGVNISIADFFCLILFIVFILKKQLLVPFAPTIYFIIVSTMVLITSVFYIPSRFMYTPSPVGIMSEYSKLIAIFLYFIFGFNLAKNNMIGNVVKVYSYFGLLVGGTGVIFTLLNMHLFSEILYYEGTRFRGLMIDPNYFSVLQVTALVYLTRLKTIKATYQGLAMGVVGLSILTSGSKTGIITLACYLAFRLAEYLFIQKKQALSVVLQIFGAAFVVMIIPFVFSFLSNISDVLGESLPAFARVQLLFTDFGSAISQNGSGRDITWTVAMELIQLSPIIGIGIGTYRIVAIELFHVSDISHNTFLQLSAEWGLPLACIFFSYVFFILGKATLIQRRKANDMNIILRDIIIILFIGSMAISLNNARILWLIIGALVYCVNRDTNIKGIGVKT